MALKLTFLGTGGAFTDFRANYHNNAILHVGHGKVVLIDCGGTAVQSLKELGIPVWDAPVVLVTHLHGDHIGGIEQLGWERFYTGPNGVPGWAKTNLFTPPDVYPGLRKCIEPCVDEIILGGSVARLGGFDELFTVLTPGPETTLDIEGATFCFQRTPHVVGEGVDKPSYGVLIRETGKETGGFYYTSDTIFRANIGDLYPDVDVIFHDCTFSPKYPGTVHTHYADLLTLPPDVRARTVLMHHTKVPDGVSPREDGFLWAAGRHDSFVLEGDRLTISGPNGGGVFVQEGGAFKKAASVRVG